MSKSNYNYSANFRRNYSVVCLVCLNLLPRRLLKCSSICSVTLLQSINKKDITVFKYRDTADDNTVLHGSHTIDIDLIIHPTL